MIIHLHKPHKSTTITFEAELLEETASYRLVQAFWERPRLDLGYIVFETGDTFLEYYYTDRWYAIFEIRTPTNALKGWYCNISYPARFTPDAIHSDDLDLDLFVSADRTQRLRLDIDEFENRGVDLSDPAAYAAAYAAFQELEALVDAKTEPFG